LRARLVSLLAAACLAAAALPGFSLTFAVFGDNRPHEAGDPQPVVFGRIIQEVNRVPGLDLAVELGDKVLGSANAAVMARQYRDFQWVVSKLAVPLHYTVGNHDLGPTSYTAAFGHRYYSFDAQGCHFVVLDAYQPGAILRITGAQYHWLEQDLAAHRGAAHTFVFLHPPLWPRYSHVGSSLDRYPKDRDRLAALLARHGVKLVFVGHNHCYDLLRHGSITQFTSGGAGAELYRSPGRFHHFLVVKVEGPAVTVTLHRVGAAPQVVYRAGVGAASPPAEKTTQQ